MGATLWFALCLALAVPTSVTGCMGGKPATKLSSTCETARQQCLMAGTNNKVGVCTPEPSGKLACVSQH